MWKETSGLVFVILSLLSSAVQAANVEPKTCIYPKSTIKIKSSNMPIASRYRIYMQGMSSVLKIEAIPKIKTKTLYNIVLPAQLGANITKKTRIIVSIYNRVTNKVVRAKLAVFNLCPKPKILSVQPSSCVYAKDLLTINGRGFTAKGNSIIKAKGRRKKAYRPRIMSWSNTKIVIKLPNRLPVRKVGRRRYKLWISKSNKRISNKNISFKACKRKPKVSSKANKSSATGSEKWLLQSGPSGKVRSGSRRQGSKANAKSHLKLSSLRSIKALKRKQYVPQEVLALSLNSRLAESLRQSLVVNKYKLIRRKKLKALGVVISQYRLPKNMNVISSVIKLQSSYKKHQFGPNIIFKFQAEQANRSRAGSFMRWGKVGENCGRHIRIGLLDTAIDRKHKDFRSSLIESKNFSDKTLKNSEKLHGTAITSLWVSSKIGLIPRASVYIAGVFSYDKRNNNFATTGRIVEGLDWLLKKNVAVVNMSFAGANDSLLELILEKMSKKGVITVAAAGNNGPGATPAYPAASREVIAVTAIDSRYRIYRKANRGKYIDFAALGVNVKVAKPGNNHKVMSGTSFAAPQVAAALALLVKQKGFKRNGLLIF